MMLPFARHSAEKKSIAVKKHQNLRHIVRKSVFVFACTMLSACNGWVHDVNNYKGSGFATKDFSLHLDLHPKDHSHTLVDLRVTNKSDQNMCISNDIQFYYDEFGTLQLTYGDNLINEAGLPELHFTLKPGSTFTLHKDMDFYIDMIMSRYNITYGYLKGGYIMYSPDADSSQIFDEKYFHAFDTDF